MSAVEKLLELQRRKLDGLKMIRLFEKQAEIAADPSFEVLCAGGNRGSKSFTAAARFASIARDVPLQTMEGDFIRCRQPHQVGRKLIMWVVGDHLKHIGQNIYRFLFKPGMFYMVRDELTGGWRSWNPAQYPDDWNRIPDRVEGPPLIPDSEIDWDNSAWYHKNLRQFEKISLKNGTEIFAFASAAEMMQGTPIDVLWFDENIVDKRWYDEGLNRLTDKSGSCFWSTIPRDDCFKYVEVEERAEAQKDEQESGHRKQEDVFCRHYILSQQDNPFLPKEQKQIRMEQMSERDRLIRIEGVRSTDVIRIYQTFDQNFHTVLYRDPTKNDAITKALENNNWEPPKEWTRYLALDPGTQKPAVLFITIPPVELWDEGEPYIIPYDELYVPRLNAFEIAERIVERHRNQFFEKFFIDGQAARQKPMGFSHTIGHQYEIAFEEHGLSSRHGTFFEPGDPSFHQRSGLVHKSMRMRKCGYPQLRVLTARCPNLVKQLLTNTRKLAPDGTPTEDPADGQRDDVRVCLEYAVSRHITYREPPYAQFGGSPTLRRYHEERQRAEQTRAHSPNSNSVLCGVTG